jgi:hypothetical protein
LNLEAEFLYTPLRQHCCAAQKQQVTEGVQMANTQAKSKAQTSKPRSPAAKPTERNSASLAAPGSLYKMFDLREFAEQPFNGQANKKTVTAMRLTTLVAEQLQDIAQTWVKIGQKQWNLNAEGISKLVQAGSPEEFAGIQRELFQASLEQITEDSRALFQRSVDAFGSLRTSFADAAKESVSADH